MITININNKKSIRFKLNQKTEILTFTSYGALKIHLKKLIKYIVEEKIHNLRIVNKVDGTVRTFNCKAKEIKINNKQRIKKVLKPRYLPNKMVTAIRSDKDIKNNERERLVRACDLAIKSGNMDNVKKYIQEMNNL
ncbi:hypothetical protein CMI47_16510 [Candidatus Pacearchaeota archaeon]|jgi:hypothetical protein|nr:hypothetical protein [Candidatus Pacearchaeota archaeon]|tara:strand:- start:11322 stop:11729 length:408 start_codon:yes stop_codon:yes gene_type:complete